MWCMEDSVQLTRFIFEVYSVSKPTNAEKQTNEWNNKKD